MKTLLIYGATGKAGRLVMERALERGWAVAAFVRNPDKVPTKLDECRHCRRRKSY